MAVALETDLRQVDILAIKRMIPHRYPFLMVDRVVEPAARRVGGRHQDGDRRTSRISRGIFRPVR